MHGIFDDFYHKHALVRCPCALRLRLVTLGLSDRSPCAAVRMLRSLAQPSHHFGPLRSLSLRRDANLLSLTQTSRHFGRIRSLSLWRVVWRGVHFYRQGDLAQRSWQVGFFKRACAEILPRRPLIEILHRELVQRSCKEILPRGLLPRSCQEGSYKELAQRSLKQILPRDLL